MSQRDNFLGGFLAGTVVGGAVGGILGVLLASKLPKQEPATEESFKLNKPSGRKRQMKPPTEQSIEAARRGLEDKIAQLNEAIDDVRQQLGNVNGNAKEEGTRTIAQDS
jgi:gas vesicle protein